MTSKVTIQVAGTAATAGDQSPSINVGNVTPFLPGRTVRAIFDARGQTGTAPVYQLDGSNDDTVWVEDICDSDVILGEGISARDVPVYEYMRVTVTTAAGTVAGTLGVHLEANG